MYQLNPLLLETSAIRKAVDAGKISPDRVKKLLAAGMLPSLDRMNQGVVKGANNMFKKHHVLPIPAIKGTEARSITSPNLHLAYVPSSDLRKYKDAKLKGLYGIRDPRDAAITRWHEAREVARGNSKTGKRYMDLLKDFDKETNKRSEYSIFRNPLKKAKAYIDDTIALNSVHSQSGNGHMPGVMRDELRLRKAYANRYGLDDRILNVVRSPLELKLARMTPTKELKYRKKVFDKETLRYKARKHADGVVSQYLKDHPNATKQEVNQVFDHDMELRGF